MRSPVLVLVLLGAALASGCVSPGGVLSPGRATPAAASADDLDAAAADPTFCQSASGCDFWDDDYHEYVLYDVDTPVIDVLIVPSASQDTRKDTPTMKAAVDAWSAGIEQTGATWLTDAFAMNVYVLGTDSPPQEALLDPEIVVLAAEYNPVLLLGIGLEPKQTVCSAFGQEALREYPVHAHPGMEIAAADCTGIGFLCVAANTNFFFGNQRQLYDLVAHEVGHCLGPGHVGDALDFSAKRVPVHDIMSYQDDPTQVHCVSTLNLRVLEGLYAPLLGQTAPPALHAGNYHTMPRADYAQVACVNPPS